jgi:hypothetical protein
VTTTRLKIAKAKKIKELTTTVPLGCVFLAVSPLMAGQGFVLSLYISLGVTNSFLFFALPQLGYCFVFSGLDRPSSHSSLPT